MLNRNIPIYEGNLPYMYACYSPEDEMLVLPILTRMYNEGFRFWSACLAEKLSDFIAVRHVSTSACVVMFMSHNMLERINAGVPEVLAACRSSLLRAVILLDDARPDNRIFALSAPERMEYQRSNDSSFWLYAYSADYLERCRGPWPEIKLSVHEPTYEDVVGEEVIAAEYISLEKIINRGGSDPEKIAAAQPYPNNKGYIPPKPDDLKYEPLGKVEAARTVHDRDYDDALALLNQCADKQIDIIINHTRPGENTVPSLPSLSPIQPMPDKQAELEAIRQELISSAEPVERPERRVDPEVRTKADMVVEPEDKPEPVEEQKEEIIPAAYIPQPEITVESIAEGIRMIAEGESAQSAQETTPVEVPEQTAEMIADEAQFPAPEISVEEEFAAVTAEDWSEPVEDKRVHRNTAGSRSTVQVVVRRQQPAVRVTPVRKRVITEPALPAREESSRPRLSRSSLGGSLRTIENDTIAFEQYVRNIALAAVSANESTGEAAPAVSHRHFGRAARTQEAAVTESAVQTVAPVAEPAVPAVAAVKSENVADVQPAAVASAADAPAAEKTSPRKNRYPHNSEVLSGLLAALRRERGSIQEENAPAAASEPAEVIGEASVSEPESIVELPRTEPIEESGVKVIRLSDAISERKVSDLQAAVNKFMRLDNAPEAAPLVARAYLRRR